MATVERFSSFEEMEKAAALVTNTGKRKSKGENTIKAFAELLRKNQVQSKKPKS